MTPFLDFSAALREMKLGKKVRRFEWGGYIQIQRPDEHSKMSCPYIYAVCKGGEVVPAVINMLDMMAEDWEVVE